MLDWVGKIRDVYRCNRERRQLWRDGYLADEEISQPKRSVLSIFGNHWEGLTVFLSHPEVPMDNNISERGARKIAMLRNASFGSGSHASGLLQASIMSIFQTLLLWGINPERWLHAYLQACADNGGKVPENITSFLPWACPKVKEMNLKSHGYRIPHSIRDRGMPNTYLKNRLKKLN